MEILVGIILSLVVLRVFGIDIFSDDSEALKTVAAAGGIIAAFFIATIIFR